ncbi:MAG: hypothetical protein J3R72DRAFT_460523 [Linnemannia gamsii]|nr:MAG: hypothetical protein J3R72DRAFT_460523 [Linnemannia gamsii]
MVFNESLSLTLSLSHSCVSNFLLCVLLIVLLSQEQSSGSGVWARLQYDKGAGAGVYPVYRWPRRVKARCDT